MASKATHTLKPAAPKWLQAAVVRQRRRTAPSRHSAVKLIASEVGSGIVVAVALSVKSKLGPKRPPVFVVTIDGVKFLPAGWVAFRGGNRPRNQ